MVNKLAIIPILCFLLTSQGCLETALFTGAGYGVYKAADSKMGAMKTDDKTKDHKTYNGYKKEMQKINQDREKAGLKSWEIMTYEEWLAADTPKPNEKKGLQKREQTFSDSGPAKK